MATKAQLQSILQRHRGARNAIRVKTLAELLGAHERKVRLLKRELADEMLIGSCCQADHPGYYVPETQDEIDATIGNYYARVRALFGLILATQGAPGIQRFMQQLTIEFEGETR